MASLKKIQEASDYLDNLPLEFQPIVTDAIVDTEPHPNEGKFWITVAEEVKRRIQSQGVSQ
jgi:hypothetical protein